MYASVCVRERERELCRCVLMGVGISTSLSVWLRFWVRVCVFVYGCVFACVFLRVCLCLCVCVCVPSRKSLIGVGWIKIHSEFGVKPKEPKSLDFFVPFHKFAFHIRHQIIFHLKQVPAFDSQQLLHFNSETDPIKKFLLYARINQSINHALKCNQKI